MAPETKVLLHTRNNTTCTSMQAPGGDRPHPPAITLSTDPPEPSVPKKRKFRLEVNYANNNERKRARKARTRLAAAGAGYIEAFNCYLNIIINCNLIHEEAGFRCAWSRAIAISCAAHSGDTRHVGCVALRLATKCRTRSAASLTNVSHTLGECRACTYTACAAHSVLPTYLPCVGHAASDVARLLLPVIHPSWIRISGTGSSKVKDHTNRVNSTCGVNVHFSKEK
ncbi:hypothetical protein C8R43DRAFT_942658 [Mycena crocata]|nr:hypothetical protein C8R43DRAFT_942658 [Mycena crocata]